MLAEYVSFGKFREDLDEKDNIWVPREFESFFCYIFCLPLKEYSSI